MKRAILFAVLVCFVFCFSSCGRDQFNGFISGKLPENVKIVEYGKFPPEGTGFGGVRECVIEREGKQFLIVYDGDCIAITQIK